MTALGILWFILIAVVMTGYFVLDGFDLGIGVLYPFLGKNEQDKKIMRQAIGPVWDGNEVWVLTAGGAMFAAFAPAYATSFSGFYLAIMLVLFGLILRAVSIEFRSHETDFLGMWDAFFFIGSLLPALLFGVAIGNVLGGLPLDANGDYTGSFFALLNPFALLCGVLGLTHMLFQGTCWLALKAPAGSDIQVRAANLRAKIFLAPLVVFIAVSLMYVFGVAPFASYSVGCLPLAVAAAALYIVSTCLSFTLCKPENSKRDLLALILASVGAVALIILLGASLFPNLIPATNPQMSITIATAQATDATLLPMTIIAGIGVPIMLAYHVFTYYIFKGRIK